MATPATTPGASETGTSLNLDDGRTITIRELAGDDVDRAFLFFCSLPEEDRKYLRTDVTRRDLVERRTTDFDPNRVQRLVAVVEDEIVADGALELEGHGWGDRVAEVRLIVARPWQRFGLGTAMARELFHRASQQRVDRIVVRMMRPQVGAHRIFRRLGFNEEFLIPEHVRDQDGTWQDLIIMRCPLEDLWKKMEDVLESGDWRSHR